MLELRIKVPKSRKYDSYKAMLIESLRNDPSYKDAEVVVRDDRRDKGEVSLIIGFDGASPFTTVIKCNVDSTLCKNVKETKKK